MPIQALAALSLALLGQLSLVPDPGRWAAGTDGAGASMTMLQTPDAKVAVDIDSDGKAEHYPKLTQSWAAPQDWGKYMRIKSRMRITCDDPAVREKNATFVIYDQQTRREDLADRPMTQQCVAHYVPVNKWVEYSDWLVNIHRAQIMQMQIYLYDAGPGHPHKYRWEFAQLELEGVGERAAAFDTEVYSQGKFVGKRTSPVAKVWTDDGLGLVLGSGGDVSTVSLDGKAVGVPGTQPSGLLVRDVTKPDPPTMVGGAIAQKGKLATQSATVSKLGLAVQATFQSKGQYLEVAGNVVDTTGKDRAVTVYFAVPVASGEWTWWDSMAAGRTKPDGFGEFANLEMGQGYGLNGAHSKYPLGAITRGAGVSPASAAPGILAANPAPGTAAGTAAPRGAAGLTLAVRMDEPIVHRIAYNPALHLLYIAADFGLVPEKRVNGTSLAQAPFRFLLYRHDPAWGFRSALQRYYGFFPEFFTNRIPAAKQGGWYVWGKMQDMAGALDAGFQFHWGPAGPEAVKWNNEKGTTSLIYIEPEYLQLTMGDFKDAPTADQCVDRLKKLAAGDEQELAKTAKLGYAGGYAPALWVKEHSLKEMLQRVATAAVNSAYYDSEGHLYNMIGKLDWMTESRYGDIFPCSLDPKIPGGKGRFNSDVYLDAGLREMEQAGAHYDGIGLDSLGGYGQDRVSYRREHFKYADIPLSFSAVEHVPAQVAHFATIEWMRELAKDMHGKGKLLMANCSWGTTPAWLTFGGVYLDIFGAEAPQFADPDYMRAIAYRKSCTDLPYNPVPDWQIPWHLLHGIYPGHGNKVELMKQYAATLRDLATAGWEPITYARGVAVRGAGVSPAASAVETPAPRDDVRIERFGSGSRIYLSVHNPEPEAAQVAVTVDAKALGLRAYTATLLPTKEALAVTGDAFTLKLDSKGTALVLLTKD